MVKLIEKTPDNIILLNHYVNHTEVVDIVTENGKEYVMVRSVPDRLKKLVRNNFTE